MASVILNIPGKPIGKGRPKFSRRGAYVQTYTPEKTVAYENLVQLAWIQAGHEKLNGCLKVRIDACFKIPSSVSKKKHEEMRWQYYPHKADADNIAKSILDALNGIAFDDDAQVVELSVTKRYSPCDVEAAVVILEEIGEVVPHDAKV